MWLKTQRYQFLTKLIECWSHIKELRSWLEVVSAWVVLFTIQTFLFVYLQVPQNPSFLEQMSDVFDPSVTSAAATSSSSCPALGTENPTPAPRHGGRQRQDHPPPFLTEDEARLWAKERQKKDNHNQSTSLSLFACPSFQKHCSLCLLKNWVFTNFWFGHILEPSDPKFCFNLICFNVNNFFLCSWKTKKI